MQSLLRIENILAIYTEEIFDFLKKENKKRTGKEFVRL